MIEELNNDYILFMLCNVSFQFHCVKEVSNLLSQDTKRPASSTPQTSNVECCRACVHPSSDSSYPLISHTPSLILFKLLCMKRVHWVPFGASVVTGSQWRLQSPSKGPRGAPAIVHGHHSHGAAAIQWYQRTLDYEELGSRKEYGTMIWGHSAIFSYCFFQNSL